MRSLIALVLLTILSTAIADPTQLPLIIWHGLGDDFARDGLKEVASLASQTNPGTYVHVIRLADTGSADMEATFFGNVTEQISQVCEQLSSDPVLSTAPSVNALGFSQGGQFLRGYIERCNSPPVRNLVTFGSQHNGISEFPACKPMDFVCRGGEALLNAGKWSALVQGRLVPAQYFRDPEDLDDYFEYSNFLADVNNERETKNETYSRNMRALNRFAMFMFEDDHLVVPKQSAWFAEVNETSGKVTPLDERRIYTEDWLGLKELGEKGKLDFLTAPGEHMQISHGLLEKTFKEYFGPVDLKTGDEDEDDFVFVNQAG